MVLTTQVEKVEPELIALKSMYVDEVSRDYLTHAFDRYPAKMIPQMASFLVKKYTKPGDTVLDPFCGSGAVLIESAVNGRNGTGLDLNPLAVIYATAKATQYDLSDLEEQLKTLLSEFSKCKKGDEYHFLNSGYWFTPATLRKFGIITKVLRENAKIFDDHRLHFWQAVTASTVRACSRADTRGPKPFISKHARRFRTGKHYNPIDVFALKANQLIEMHQNYLAKIRKNRRPAILNVMEGDARHLSRYVRRETIDAIITSPPYLNAQDYYRSSKLELFILRITKPERVPSWARSLVGSDRIIEGSEFLHDPLPFDEAERVRVALICRSKRNAAVFAKYVQDMDSVFKGFALALKNSGFCCLISGSNLISTLMIPIPRINIEIAARNGFRLERYYLDEIRDHRVPPQRNGHNGIIEKEHICILRKG